MYGIFFCAIRFYSLSSYAARVFNKNTEVLQMAGMLLLFAAVFRYQQTTHQAIAAGLMRHRDVKIPTILLPLPLLRFDPGLPAGYAGVPLLKLGPAGGGWSLLSVLHWHLYFSSPVFSENGKTATKRLIYFRHCSHIPLIAFRSFQQYTEISPDPLQSIVCVHATHTCCLSIY